VGSRPFEAYRARRVEQVNRRYDAYLAAGFPTADFDGQPEPETLQCRHELDRTNWLGLLIKCLAARDAGAGDVPMDPPIRCTSNRMYAVTYTDALARMFVLLDQAGAAQANWWRLKDLVRDCERREDLARIDLEEGWP
jgi:hypothetical protein